MAQAEPMHTTVEEALLGRLELIQGPCNGTGENEPSFKIVRTVTSGYTPRCYNWGLFREGRFSQPPSCQNFTPVVISHAPGWRREGVAVCDARLTAPVCAKIACERYRRFGRTIPTAKVSSVPEAGILGLQWTQPKPNGNRVTSCPIPSTY